MKTAKLVSSLSLLALSVFTAPGQMVFSYPGTAVRVMPPTYSAPFGRNLFIAIPPAIAPGTTNVAAAQLGATLQDLQFQLLQALPTLAAFNDNFDFLDSAGIFSAALANVSPANYGTSLAVNYSTNLGVNYGVSLGQDLSQSLAVSTGGTAPGTIAIGNGGRGILIPPTAVPTIAPVSGLSFPLTRESLAALIILQNDIQRTVNMLEALNSGVFWGTNGSGSFDNH